MKKTILLIAASFIVSILKAQTIHINLPRLAGEEYAWLLYNGTHLDTIQTGNLDVAGKTKLKLPEAQKGYTGMSSLRLKKDKASLDFIVNEENFSISSSAPTLIPGNVTFTGSAENNFLMEQYKVQQATISKLKLLKGLRDIYPSDGVFYMSVSKEFKNVQRAKQKQDAVLQKTSLYAARFLQLRDYLGEQAEYWQKTQAEITRLRADGVRNFNTEMYNSSLWKPAFEYWFSMYHDGLQSDSLFIEDVAKMLQNKNYAPLLNELGNNLVDICESYGWEKPKMQIAFAIQKSGKLPQPTGNLARLMGAFAAVPGNQAPNIDLGNGRKISDLSAPQYIVLFYETGCGHCDDEIIWLKQRYQQLREKGVEVISIASDLDKKTAQVSLDAFPWTEKLCDLKGFEGENFKTYGVIGTPTIFILDKDKKITGKYGKFSDAKQLE